MSGKRIGVFICACGPNIAERIDIEAMAEELSVLDDVVLSETFGLLCSPAGKDHLVKRISENGLDRVVIAACSPREHEKTFSVVCGRAGINPFMMEMANIREQVAWVTPDSESARRKSMRMIQGAIARVRHHRPLETRTIEADPRVMIIGGGLAGMSASLLMADAGRSVTILEKTGKLGGPGRLGEKDITSTLAGLIDSHPGIDVLTGTVPDLIAGFLGGFIISLNGDQEEKPMELRAGSIVLATGSATSDDGTEIPPAGFAELAEMLRVETNDSGYPLLRHGTLHPVSTPIEGVFLCGRIGGAASTTAVLASAEAVSGAILSTLIPGRLIQTEPKTSVISPVLCAGCRTCMDVCGFAAISYDEELSVCTVNSVLCKGCGNCAAACPSGAIRSQHFMPDQIGSQIAGLLS